MTDIAWRRASVGGRVAALFESIDDYEEERFIAEVDALAGQLPATTLTASSIAPARRTRGAPGPGHTAEGRALQSAA